jgi:lysophospholipase L1-like esterase
MTRIRPLSVLVLALALLLAGAAAPARAQDTGSADFSRFVAVGDSLGAGFLSGGLVRGAQEDSVPALIARQATGAVIGQPLVSEPGIPALLRLVNLVPLQIVQLPGQGSLVQPRPYDNLSVPGFRVGDALRTFTGNPIIDLVLQGQGTQLQQALAKNPTFALVWLGNNDVLAAATSGRVIEGVTLTPVAQFQADYTAVVGALKGAGADLALANLPDVTSIPFVTTIPPVVVNPATGQPVPGPGGNPIPLIGPNGPLGPGDRVLLPASAALAQGIGIPAAVGGTNQPLPDSLVLSAAEVNTIQARVNAFNQIIAQTASATGSSLADVNALLRQVNSGGINVGGIVFTADYITGGSFSLDGVHPAPLGYAVAANEFIRSINATYGAGIPPVDLFPFVFGEDASAIPSIPGAVTEFIFTRGAAKQLEDALRVYEPARPGRRPPRGRRPPERGRDLPTLRPRGH